MSTAAGGQALRKKFNMAQLSSPTKLDGRLTILKIRLFITKMDESKFNILSCSIHGFLNGRTYLKEACECLKKV